MMKTVIMAGGKGSRISELFPDIPKPLIPIYDKPVLEWGICGLRAQGFKDIILTVSYLAQTLIDYFGDGSKWGVDINYFVENEPLGNAGALFKLDLDDDFLLLNADSVFDVDFNRFLSFHRGKRALVTLFTHPNSHPYDSGLIISSVDGAVGAWLTKEDKRPEWYKNRVNAGLHIINPDVLRLSGVKTDEVDLDRQILKPLCGTGKMFAYDSPEYVKDMGTPERYYSVSRDFESGIVAAKNLHRPQKAIFLDRDGTINRYVGFLRTPEEFELLPGVAEAIQFINSSGYLAIIITNQPVIARGEVSVSELEIIHNKMETELGRYGAYIDGIYYCPHHPDSGYKGEIKELKIDCDCRKPKPGMLLKAAKDFNIDLTASWMVGDDVKDILAGQAAGCHTAIIGDKDVKVEVRASSLYEAIRKILC